MSRSQVVEAIVLHTHDVGEADRFCLLFTKEHGKLAARVRGVRKPKSRLGGSVLALHHCELELREGSAGHYIVDAKALLTAHEYSPQHLLYAQQGVELLLKTLHDEEPLPELFATAIQFLHYCRAGATSPTLPFTIKLLHHMGVLPEASETTLTNTQRTFVRCSTHGSWAELPELTPRERQEFSPFCAALLGEILSQPLKSGLVLQALTTDSAATAPRVEQH